MPETVRVRCAVAVSDVGDVCIHGDTTEGDRHSVTHALSMDTDASLQFVTVEIPLPVEPVVVAEPETRRVRYSDGGPLKPLRHELEAGDGPAP